MLREAGHAESQRRTKEVERSIELLHQGDEEDCVPHRQSSISNTLRQSRKSVDEALKAIPVKPGSEQY